MRQIISLLVLALFLTCFGGCFTIVVQKPAVEVQEVVPVYSAHWREEHFRRMNRNGVQLGPSFSGQRRGYVVRPVVVVVPQVRRQVRTVIVRPAAAQRQQTATPATTQRQKPRVVPVTSNRPPGTTRPLPRR